MSSQTIAGDFPIPKVMLDSDRGWICPKCGAPNNPKNKLCTACFSPYSVAEEEGDSLLRTLLG